MKKKIFLNPGFLASLEKPGALNIGPIVWHVYKSNRTDQVTPSPYPAPSPAFFWTVLPSHSRAALSKVQNVLSHSFSCLLVCFLQLPLKEEMENSFPK